MPDGSLVKIDHLSVDIAKETLGVFTCPSGDALAQFLSILQKGQKWIDHAVESHLQRRDIWFPLYHQLWPRLDMAYAAFLLHGRSLRLVSRECGGRFFR